MNSAYDSSITINDDHGAVTILAYRTGWHFGGHTHLAFEYIEVTGVYRHVVFHLVALGGQYGQMCTGTSATVLKQVPIRGDQGQIRTYGFVGGEGAFQKAQQRAQRRGQQLAEDSREDYMLGELYDYERNLPNNDNWTTKSYRSRTIRVPTEVSRKGRFICRKLIKGVDDDETAGIETQRFHKLDRKKGTTCMLFAMQVLVAIDIIPNTVMQFHAIFSPPEAIKSGRLYYIGT